MCLDLKVAKKEIILEHMGAHFITEAISYIKLSLNVKANL